MKLENFILSVAGRSGLSARIRTFKMLPWIVLLISLVVTVELWSNANQEAEEALELEFKFSVRDASQLVERQMQSYAKLLAGLQGFFMAAHTVDREMFRTYYNALNLEKNYPGIQALGYAQIVNKEQRHQHIGSIRKEGFPLYTIMPEGNRDIYTSLVYLEPFSGRNLQAFGYDTFTDPVRRAGMERARDTGLNSISAKITLLQETDVNKQAGILMWLPVYKKGSAHNTLETRRENIVGWVSAVFRMDDLLTRIFDINDSKVDIEIYDGEQLNDQTLLVDADHIRREKNKAGSRFQAIQQLSIAGNKWSLVISSLPNFDKRLKDQKHQAILLGGIAISALLSFITWVLVNGRARAIKHALTLSHQLAERRRAEAGQHLAATVFESVDTAVLVTDEHTRIIKVNPAFTEITGYSAEDALGKTPHLLASGAHSKDFYKNMWNTLSASGNWQGEIFNRRKNGEFFTEWLSINEVRDDEDTLTNYVALFSDISERKAAEEHMTTLAHYDPLTGLPNRTLLTDRLQQALAAAKREKTHMVIMFIDLDKFKPVNDALGHHIGDLMLKEVAIRILGCLRESDSAARIGGDEFVVLLPIIEADADAVAVAEKIRAALNQPFELAGNSLNISSSIGVAEYPEHGSDEKVLLRNADTAMYFAKEAGRNTVKLFNSTMQRQHK